MLQLKHMRLLAEMSGAKYHEITPHMFGVNWNLSSEEQGYQTFVAASCRVPDNSGLVVCRVQCYMVNVDEGATDWLFYRTYLPEDSYWQLANTPTFVSGTTVRDYSKAWLDTDVLLLFPGNFFANLIFTPTGAIPATGQWVVRTAVYGYFVPARVIDVFQQSQFVTSGV
jgi:hypothetical protein